MLLRMKDDNDSAEPAASSVEALNLARFAAITNDSQLETRARKTVNAFARQLSHFPSAMPQMLVAFDFVERGATQLVIAGSGDEKSTQDLLKEIRSHFLPRTVVILLDDEASRGFLAERNEEVRTMKPINGKPAAYVCRNFTCQAPVTDRVELGRLLSRT